MGDIESFWLSISLVIFNLKQFSCKYMKNKPINIYSLENQNTYRNITTVAYDFHHI